MYIIFALRQWHIGIPIVPDLPPVAAKERFIPSFFIVPALPPMAAKEPPINEISIVRALSPVAGREQNTLENFFSTNY